MPRSFITPFCGPTVLAHLTQSDTISRQQVPRVTSTFLTFATQHATKHKAKLNTLAVAGPSEVGTLPGIPNVKKWGYMTTWGVMAPPGTPADRVKVLNAALLKATADPKVRNMVIKNGLQPMRQTVEEAAAYVAAAVKKHSN